MLGLLNRCLEKMVGLFFFPLSFWDPHTSSFNTACISYTGSIARWGVEGYVCPRCKLQTWKRISLAELLSPSPPPPPGQNEGDCCPFHIPQIREAGVTIVPLFRQEDRQPLGLAFLYECWLEKPESRSDEADIPFSGFRNI